MKQKRYRNKNMVERKKKETKDKHSFFYNVDGIYITRHALLRYMQRYHKGNEQSAKKELVEFVSKSNLVSMARRDDEIIEKRLYSIKQIFLICKVTYDKTLKKRILSVITVTMPRVAQLRHFSTNVNNIDYNAMGNSRVLKSRRYKNGGKKNAC